MEPKRRSLVSATNSNNGPEEPSHFRHPVHNSNSRNPKSHLTKLSSLRLKSVMLLDWWLANPEKGKGLAIGGLASRDLGVRAFHSSAIVKRLDATTLETADGITVTISGLINRSRTHINGFPLEVCNNFLHGFPYHWEEYADKYRDTEQADKYRDTEQADKDIQNETFSSTEVGPSSQVSLEDTPVTRIRDLLILRQVNSESFAVGQRIFIEALKKFSCSQHETPKLKKAKVNAKMMGLRDDLTPCSGVITRSMARQMNLRTKNEENFPLKSSASQNTAPSLMTPEGSSFRSVELLSRNGSKWFKAKTFSRSEKGPREGSIRTAVRRLM